MPSILRTIPRFPGRISASAFKAASLALGLALLATQGFAQEYGGLGEAVPELPRGVDREVPTTEIAAPLEERTVGRVAEASPMFEVVDEDAYIVGPGDVLYISVGTRSFNVLIGPDGAAVVQTYPPVEVAGKSLKEARRVISQKLKQYYKASGIYVALAEAKKFQVSVTGAVNDPGMYVASAGARLSNVIRSAGGLTRQASYQATLRHADGKEITIDLGAYYRDGDLKQNPYLAQGDHILISAIDYSKPLAYVQNERGTRAVQLEATDDLESVVARSIDFENAKDWDHVNVFREGRFVEQVDRVNAKGYKLPPGTTVEVRAKQLVVFVGGTVVAPGSYPYNPTFTILDYVAKSGIHLSTGSATRVKLIDAQGNYRKVDANKESPRPGDHILVPRSLEAKVRDYIGLMTAVASLAIGVATLVAINQNN